MAIQLLEQIPVVGGAIKLGEEVADALHRFVVHSHSHNPIQHAVNEIDHYIGELWRLGLHKPLSWSDWRDNPAIFPIREFTKLEFGVDLEAHGDPTARAAATIERVFGMAILFPMAVGGLGLALTAIGARRISEGALELVGKIPEEIGVSWALGMFMNNVLESAIGQSIQEAIQYQTRPSRMETMVIMRLMRQHRISVKDARAHLALQGYRREDIDILVQLDRASLPIAELQQLFLYKRRTRAEVKDYLRHLGYTDKDAEGLVAMYIDHAATQAGALLRTTARQEVLLGNMLLSDYQTILEQAHEPDAVITDDVKAIKLELDRGHHALSITAVRQQYLTGGHDQATAITQLANLGYSRADALTLIAQWADPHTTRPKVLSASQVLRYFVSSLLSHDEAKRRLLNLGYADGDAEFLLAHPLSRPAVHQLHLSAGTLSTAFVDGAIDEPKLRDELTKLGYNPTSVDHLVAIAKERSHTPRPGVPGHTGLTLADLRQGYKDGLLGYHDLLTRIEALGYSSDDATFLAELANKGPYAAPPPPLFPTLQAAIDYLVHLGFQVKKTPIDYVGAAEAMLATAGYEWTPPPNFVLPIEPTGGLLP